MERTRLKLRGPCCTISPLSAAKEGGRLSFVPLPPPREGHASLVRELKESLGTPPGAVVLSVGGGGLLAGVTAGLLEVGWPQVPIVAMETRGAHSFNAALQAGRLVTLPDITRWVWVEPLRGWRVGCLCPMVCLSKLVGVGGGTPNVCLS